MNVSDLNESTTSNTRIRVLDTVERTEGGSTSSMSRLVAERTTLSSEQYVGDFGREMDLRQNPTHGLLVCVSFNHTHSVTSP